MVLRTQQQAVYHYENRGHFGLGYDDYLHFTSPIRRYPDLIVHRTLKHILNADSESGFAYTKSEMESASHNVRQWSGMLKRLRAMPWID